MHRYNQFLSFGLPFTISARPALKAQARLIKGHSFSYANYPKLACFKTRVGCLKEET